MSIKMQMTSHSSPDAGQVIWGASKRSSNAILHVAAKTVQSRSHTARTRLAAMPQGLEGAR